jgi:hypothetical protein
VASPCLALCQLSRSSSISSLTSMLNASARCSKPSPLAFCERFRRCYPGNPPVLEGMIFGIGLSVAPIGEQADNLEAIRRAAAYQDCHRHVGSCCLAVAACERHDVRRVSCSLQRASGDGKRPAAICGAADSNV